MLISDFEHLDKIIKSNRILKPCTCIRYVKANVNSHVACNLPGKRTGILRRQAPDRNAEEASTLCHCLSQAPPGPRRCETNAPRGETCPSPADGHHRAPLRQQPARTQREGQQHREPSSAMPLLVWRGSVQPCAAQYSPALPYVCSCFGPLLPYLV